MEDGGTGGNEADLARRIEKLERRLEATIRVVARSDGFKAEELKKLLAS